MGEHAAPPMTEDVFLAWCERHDRRYELVTAEPVTVAEVLSPSTRAPGLVFKVEEDISVPTLRHILLIDPDAAPVSHWPRTSGTPRSHSAVSGPVRTITLDDPHVEIDRTVLNKGTSFPSRLVEEP